MNPDPETVEAIARWLESAARHGQAWERRRLAEILRNGEWEDAIPFVTDHDVLLRRAQDKIARCHPLTRVEAAVMAEYETRQQNAADARTRRDQKILDSLEMPMDL